EETGRILWDEGATDRRGIRIYPQTADSFIRDGGRTGRAIEQVGNVSAAYLPVSDNDIKDSTKETIAALAEFGLSGFTVWGGS
ncbi:MAG: hypothetical protein Q4B42_04715, partial [Oscillospiraceae bacterium]|nr:hypothetical protein [Oscillospiraceae bacterium]